jgi:hypothetical protein
VKMHKAFLDDDNLTALLVTCIPSLSPEPARTTSEETVFGKIYNDQSMRGLHKFAAKVIR